MNSKDKPLTLSDADISSERSVSRRSVLGILGIGAGAAAAASFGAVTRPEAAVVDVAIGDIVGSPGAKKKRKALKTSKSPKGKSPKQR